MAKASSTLHLCYQRRFLVPSSLLSYEIIYILNGALSEQGKYLFFVRRES